MAAVVAPSFSSPTHSCLSPFATPYLFGAEILNINSNVVSNYTVNETPIAFLSSDPPLNATVTGLSFCNVTVTYTHPGQDDNINVFLWLPLAVEALPEAKTSPSWNGILLSHGGGGYSTCLPDIVSQNALTQGYAISRTDGGHAVISLTDPDVGSPSTWAQISPGNVNQYLLEAFATKSLDELSTISKQVVSSFYGTPAKHAYFQGCSTGGRQGIMLAQRYPTAYDGIVAGSPAIFWPKSIVHALKAQVMMKELGYPRPCELDYITGMAIERCDALDGVQDGIISNESACHFDPFSLWPAFINCTMRYMDQEDPITDKVNLSSAAVQIASDLWSDAGRPKWHPVTHPTPLSSKASTKCFHANNSCIADPDQGSMDWLRLFVYKDPNLTPAQILDRLDEDELDRLFRLSDLEYHSLLSSSSADLSEFYKHGGKLLVEHGLSDDTVVPGGTIQYYNSVLDFAKSPASNMPTDVNNVLRLFMAPGIQHCGFGPGVLPINVLASLRHWVEDGEPPDTLEGQSYGRADNVTIRRRLCMYPQVARYVGPGMEGDWAAEENFICANAF